jgi:hypothetical protein
MAQRPFRGSSLILIPAFLFLVLTTFVFWMSPIGIGFSDGAEKLKNPIFFVWFQFVYWLGPAALIAVPFTLLTLDAAKRLDTTLIGIVFAAIFLLLFLQIGTLIYVSG